MKLVNLHTGKEYETYPDQILWFERTSVDIWNYLRLTFRSSKEVVECGLPAEGLFSFWVPQETGDIVKLYPEYKITSQGELFEDYYWHNIYVLAKSKESGEFIDHLYIDQEKLYIGFPCEDEDESLRINLANKGFECSPMIQSALYHTEAEESNPNYVVLNTKFKELLLNYMSVLGNKGSYKSLVNSLKWFEYGDLVALEQVYKNGTKYLSRPLSQELTEELQVLAVPKTTSLVLRNKSWETSYNAVERRYCKWSKDEMRLKMFLLGKFFEAYFLPIHLELLRSAVEDIEYFELVLHTGTALEVDNPTYCPEPLEVEVFEDNQWRSYKYVDKILRPSFTVHNNEVKSVIKFRFKAPFSVLGEDGIKDSPEYVWSTSQTKPTSVTFLSEGKKKTFKIVPKDDLRLDIGVYEVTRDLRRISKPKLVKSNPTSLKDGNWLMHRGLDNFMIYEDPHPSAEPLSCHPFRLDVYNYKGISFNWIHILEGQKYETVLRPWGSSKETKGLTGLTKAWDIPQTVELYNKLIKVSGQSRACTGLLAQVELNGIPVKLPKELQAKFTRIKDPYYSHKMTFVLQYTFNERLVEVVVPHELV